MITGFNTDIEFEGVTYHVQTEDKGLETPLILSLVYERGTILASKRSSYEDLRSGGFDEKKLAARLQRQHKLICAAIRAGRIDELKRMTAKESARQKDLFARGENGTSAKENSVASPEEDEDAAFDIPIPQLLDTDDEPKDAAALKIENKLEPPKNMRIGQKPGKEAAFSENLVEFTAEHIIEEVQIVEEEAILPAEAVEIITDFSRNEDLPDNKLAVEFINEAAFKGGEGKTISLLVRRGNSRSGLSGAQVMVKILGSAFRPLIFHAKTDGDGVATVNLQLPHFNRGRAAVLVKAMSGGEEVELRRIIQQG